MQLKNNPKAKPESEKDFWDNLQADLLLADLTSSQDDVRSLIEQCFIFSLLFRGCSPKELIGFQSLLQLKDYGYVMLLDFERPTQLHSDGFDSQLLHHYIKDLLKNTNHIVGPFIGNRMSILISLSKEEAMETIQDDASEQVLVAEKESLTIADLLIEGFRKKYQLTVNIGIGNITRFSAILSSYIDALYTLQFCKPNDRLHIKDIKKSISNMQFDYYETEKHMLDAVRLGKSEAYDYFVMLMNWIKPLNDTAKRNHILELLVITAHAKRYNKSNFIKYYNYVGNANELLKYSGSQLIEWAYQQFIYLTGFGKVQNSINYTNKVVQITKEYLEKHYTEDITLEDVAAQVNISPQYFSKLIKKNTGFNFIDWLSMMRVRKAKELLNNTNFTVKEICYMVGYKDPNYFSRIFKKRVGITPSEYMKNYSTNKSKS